MYNTPDWIRADVGIGSILSVNLEHHGKGWRYSHSARNHGRRTSAFVLVLDGAATYRIGRKNYRVEQNDLLFLRKGMVYDSRVTEDCVYTILVVTFNFLPRRKPGGFRSGGKTPQRPAAASSSSSRSCVKSGRAAVLLPSGSAPYRRSSTSCRCSL